MNFSSSPSYHTDFAKVAVLLMGISVWRAEEELEKLTTNNQLLRKGNGNGNASSLGFNQERYEEGSFNL